uniref:Uncharacterized protein n=1 Tax=Oryza rufipogon TaxID=4529 RepID=A0A0E0QSC5_ORYRU
MRNTANPRKTMQHHAEQGQSPCHRHQSGRSQPATGQTEGKGRTEERGKRDGRTHMVNPPTSQRHAPTDMWDHKGVDAHA